MICPRCKDDIIFFKKGAFVGCDIERVGGIKLDPFGSGYDSAKTEMNHTIP